MKRTLSLLLCLILCLSLCACGRLDRLKDVELPPLPTVTVRPESQSETPEPTDAQPAETAAAAPAAVSDTEDMTLPVIVSFQKTEMIETDPAAHEQKILTFSYLTPRVTIPGRDEAAAKINEYIGMLDETYYTGNDYGDGPSSGYNGMLEMAEDNFTYAYESGNDLLLEFESVRDARISRADGRVLTLNLGTYTYSGGAHGYYLSRAYVFDTRSGDLITLEQLSPDLPALRTYLVQRMIEMVQTDPTLAAAIDGFVEESNRETSFGALIRDGSWYLDDRGLVVFSDLYEISSYAAGMQTFVFPYEELGGLVDLKWFPDSKNSSGSFSILSMDSVQDGSFPILDMLTLEEGMTQICLCSGERAYDVTLYRTYYHDDIGSFYLSDPLWYCSCMENSGLQISTDIPDGYPNLALSYRGENGVVHRCLISQSGEDGHPLLLEEGISFAG